MNYNLHYGFWHNETKESRNNDIEGFKRFLTMHWLVPSKNAKVLELGCSMGRLMLALKEFGITDIKGVDIESEFINIAQNEGLDVVESDILEFLRNTDEKYDAIYCFDVIEHIQKEFQEELFIELYKHLNEDGFVAIKTINALAPMASYYRYLDFTHELSYAPITIEFLSKIGGFNEIVIRPEFEENEHVKILKNFFAELYYQQFGINNAVLTPNLIAVLFKSKDVADKYRTTAPQINNNYLAYHYENYPLKTIVQYYVSKLVYKLTFGNVDLYNLGNTKYKFVIFKTKK